jgi:putative tryptophan/tyrosine transport system substrate-binding protein
LNAREIGRTPALVRWVMTHRMVRRKAYVRPEAARVHHLLGGAIVARPLAAGAQQHKMLRVGFVGMQPREAPHYTNFLRRMGELGYQEGRNFTFDYIQTPNVEGYDKGYQELAARKPDVFLAVGSEPALRAALSAADGKPIAFLAVDFDPLVAAL